MTVPERVTADWIATLANGPLVKAESHLHSEFLTEESREKERRGERYALLEGPPVLINAWLRWQMVRNETQTRGLAVRYMK